MNGTAATMFTYRMHLALIQLHLHMKLACFSLKPKNVIFRITSGCISKKRKDSECIPNLRILSDIFLNSRKSLYNEKNQLSEG